MEELTVGEADNSVKVLMLKCLVRDLEIGWVITELARFLGCS
jgi:hypothetical protein